MSISFGNGLAAESESVAGLCGGISSSYYLTASKAAMQTLEEGDGQGDGTGNKKEQEGDLTQEGTRDGELNLQSGAAGDGTCTTPPCNGDEQEDGHVDVQSDQAVEDPLAWVVDIEKRVQEVASEVNHCASNRAQLCTCLRYQMCHMER